jgi:hypothetical protein
MRNRRSLALWVGLACLASALLPASPLYGQEVYFTDSWQNVKKVGPNGTVETVVADFEQTKGLAIDPSTGTLYWASAEIERVNRDGTGREAIVIGALANALGMDIDRVNGKIYWADNQAFGGSISRANLDGTNFETVIFDYSPLSMAVDPIGGKIYWNANSFNLKRANLDGSNVEVIIANQPTLGDIELDLIERKIYFDQSIFGIRHIRRANLDGSMIQTVADPADHSGGLALGLDVIGRKIYWGQCGEDTPEGVRCAMKRSNYDGSGKELVAIQGVGPEAFFDIEIVPTGDLCDLSVSYAAGALDLDFQIATPNPVTWNLWLSVQTSTVRLWSIPLPTIDPAIARNIHVPGFPQIGTVGFLTTFTTPADGIVCSSWETVDTGPDAAAVKVPDVIDKIMRSAPR